MRPNVSERKQKTTQTYFKLASASSKLAKLAPKAQADAICRRSTDIAVVRNGLCPDTTKTSIKREAYWIVHSIGRSGMNCTQRDGRPVSRSMAPKSPQWANTNVGCSHIGGANSLSFTLSRLHTSTRHFDCHNEHLVSRHEVGALAS